MKPLRSRFSGDTDKLVQEYTESISFDHRLYRQDIAGSIAHARMLARQGIISQKDADLILQGLNSIREEIDAGQLVIDIGLEDVHMHIESRLTEKIGDVAGKLHTARSRNDQVALDLRLYAKEATTEVLSRVASLQKTLVDLAETSKDIAIPAYTHLQRAQPVPVSHHLLAYFEMLQRDADRFRDCLKRVDVLPLGSGAVAGAPYPLNRASVAEELGFSQLSQNSLDAVSDRDFVIEFQAAASITMMHLSRLAEEIVLWASTEFGYVELDDAYTTGSSLMPQKKNPDVAELARGKTGRVYGHLMAILTLMKGLPLAYNRDLQEDKEGLFDTCDTLLSTLSVFKGMVGGLRFKADRTQAAAREGFMLATDIADYLVKKGIPFREAHGIVGQIVRHALDEGKGLEDLTIEDFRHFSSSFEPDVLSITPDSAMAARDILGGASPTQVEAQLERARRIMADEH